MPNKSHSSGFTLIELLIVVSIIGILSGIILVIINPQVLRNRARDGVVASDISKIIQAVEAQSAVDGTVPVDITALKASVFIKTWPTSKIAGIPDPYQYSCLDSSGDTCTKFCISTYIPSTYTGGGTNDLGLSFFKYYSSTFTGATWDFPPGKLLSNCQHSCSEPGVADGTCTPL